MRISDWSSDVCSSDLAGPHFIHRNFDRHTRFCGLSGVDGERSGGHAEQADIIAEAKMVDGKGHLCVHRIDGIGASLHAGRVWCAWQGRSEEHTSELQSLMRISSAVLCLTKKKK